MAVNPYENSFFLQGGEALANYDYTDIAEGTGVQIFYLGRSLSNGVSGAHLRVNKFYSYPVATGVNFDASGAWLKTHEIDFDVQFNMPKIIKGTAIANISYGVRRVTNHDYYTYLKTILKKVDGATVTTLATASGAILWKDTVGDYAYGMSAINMDVAQTHFKKADKLRLTTEQWCWNGNPGAGIIFNSDFFIAHDPMNRASGSTYIFGTEPSISQILVPFKIEI